MKEEKKQKECYHQNKDCDTLHRVHTYHDFQGNKIVSCYMHKPMGWKRK